MKLEPLAIEKPTPDRVDTRYQRADTPPAGSGGDGASLVERARESFEFFLCSLTREPFAQPRAGGACLRIESKAFSAALAALEFDATGKAPSAQAIGDAVRVAGVLCARGEPRPVFLRVGSTAGGELVLDLGDDSGAAVVVTGDGWRVVENAPCAFWRSGLSRPLPRPVRDGGAWASFAGLFSLSAEVSELVESWAANALFAGGSAPLLLLTGEAGSGKSLLAEHVVRLVDDCAAPLRSLGRDEESLTLSVAASWVSVLDNVSALPDWASDTLCKVSTGGAILRRQLYSDRDVVAVEARRPLVATAVDLPTLKPDLADRCLPIKLERIPDDRRESEAAIRAAFEVAWPSILGGVLDAASCMLRPAAEPLRLPRLADFGLRLSRLDAARGTSRLAEFLRRQGDASAAGVEASAVGRALLAAIPVGGSFEGAAGELLELLARHGDPDARGWPSSARKLSADLTKLSPALRALGWSVTPPAEGGRSADRKRSRLWRLVANERGS